mmetsp:Transcript_20125/g.43396  ORF Transcript_20125/g.43396 Transcript_20125/m.43396 type:complete len:280 (+) Transcript_20125:1224-2063(+)
MDLGMIAEQVELFVLTTDHLNIRNTNKHGRRIHKNRKIQIPVIINKMNRPDTVQQCTKAQINGSTKKRERQRSAYKPSCRKETDSHASYCEREFYYEMPISGKGTTLLLGANRSLDSGTAQIEMIMKCPLVAATEMRTTCCTNPEEASISHCRSKITRVAWIYGDKSHKFRVGHRNYYERYPATNRIRYSEWPRRLPHSMPLTYNSNNRAGWRVPLWTDRIWEDPEVHTISSKSMLLDGVVVVIWTTLALVKATMECLMLQSICRIHQLWEISSRLRIL